MAANAEIQHITSKGPLDTVQLAGKQFGKLTKTVVFGMSLISSVLPHHCVQAFQLCTSETGMHVVLLW